ncbi:MAG: hypothetical protein JOZ92_08640, partial [Candidatus Dormibacteraeota bacterium]|nr:hypothetical protein [Candidatus Dormibacteraeota bacterium]
MNSRVARRLVAGVMFAAVGAAVPTTSLAAAPHRAAAPLSPLVSGHSYRHGVVPSLTYEKAHIAAGDVIAASANNLQYGGGISGVGVTTGAEKVYLVFWGSQWGTQSTNGQGYATFSGDPDGYAPDIQAFMKGLGTGGETWSGVMTQYCQGVSTGSQTCPASSAHVAYPTGGALAGVWEDTSSAAPSAASGHQ